MKMTTIFGHGRGRDESHHWLSVSDLMAGLMMIFLFIAITYMRFVQIERDQIKEIVVIANDTQIAIYEALQEEFHDDLHRWNAELDRQTMTVRFKEPDVLFDRNSDRLKLEFKEILADFFPRYVRRLNAFRESIDEIRIEGHTSSEWHAGVSKEEAYFLNMDLSQRRTQSVLRYCYTLPRVADHPWLKRNIAAVGLSSSRLVLRQDGAGEDYEASRRVEFTVKTNFERRIIRTIVPETS